MTREEKNQFIWKNTDKDFRSEVGGPTHPSVLTQVNGATAILPLTTATDEQIEKLMSLHSHKLNK